MVVLLKRFRALRLSLTRVPTKFKEGEHGSVLLQHNMINSTASNRCGIWKLEVGSWQLEVWFAMCMCICSGGRKDNKQSPPILQKRAMTAHEGSIDFVSGRGGIGDRFVICECRLFIYGGKKFLRG